MSQSRVFNTIVIGCGKLGAPLLGVLAEAGHTVIGIDIDKRLIANLQDLIVTWNEPGLREVLKANSRNISFSSSFEGHFVNTHISFVIVPTPSKPDGSYNNEYVISAVSEIGKELQKSSLATHTVVIVSTVMPGSTSGEIKSALVEALGDSNCKVSICYSPEFIALGSVIKNMKYPDMILIGEEEKEAGDLLEEISRSFSLSNPKVHRLKTIEAELAKIAINSYVTTKISFSNQISEICEKSLGASADQVLSAIGSDSRIGPSYLKAATAYGGPCFPRDNRAFSKYANEVNASSAIAEATDLVNNRQFDRLLNLVSKKSNEIRKIVIVGAAYKPDTEVLEESPSIRFAESAIKRGYQVEFIDDFVKTVSSLPEVAVATSTHSKEIINEADALMLFVPSALYKDLPTYARRGATIFDLWGIWKEFENSDLISYVRLGDYNE